MENHGQPLKTIEQQLKTIEKTLNTIEKPWKKTLKTIEKPWKIIENHRTTDEKPLILIKIKQ